MAIRFEHHLLMMVFLICQPFWVFAQDVDADSGLIMDRGFELVKGHCTSCHSGKLVTQNRMTRETWLETIRWMQKEQGLWPLGNTEDPVLDYLAKNYGPLTVGRRKGLPAHLMPPKDHPVEQ